MCNIYNNTSLLYQSLTMNTTITGAINVHIIPLSLDNQHLLMINCILLITVTAVAIASLLLLERLL